MNNNYNARALAENLPALERVCKEVQWYQDPDLDDIADFVVAGDYRAAYNAAYNAFGLNSYTANCDTTAYYADFVDLLAPIVGQFSRVVNCTTHPVTIVENGVVLRSIPTSGDVARLSVSMEPAGVVLGIPITRTVFGEPVGLPEPKLGTCYIVSQLVKNALPERDDLVVPAEVVRDADGNIIGCKSLGR